MSLVICSSLNLLWRREDTGLWIRSVFSSPVHFRSDQQESSLSNIAEVKLNRVCVFVCSCAVLAIAAVLAIVINAESSCTSKWAASVLSGIFLCFLWFRVCVCERERERRASILIYCCSLWMALAPKSSGQLAIWTGLPAYWQWSGLAPWRKG